MLFSSLLAALAFASSTTALPSTLEARQASTLKAAMIARGRSFIGTSLTIRNDNSESNIIRSEFNSITPENAQKWDAIEPNRGQFNWNGADQVANFATQNGQKPSPSSQLSLQIKSNRTRHANALSHACLAQPVAQLGQPDQQQRDTDERNGEPHQTGHDQVQGKVHTLGRC
jgi:hypothetical protein